MPDITNNVHAEIFCILASAGVPDSSTLATLLIDESIRPALEAMYAAGKAAATEEN